MDALTFIAQLVNQLGLPAVLLLIAFAVWWQYVKDKGQTELQKAASAETENQTSRRLVDALGLQLEKNSTSLEALQKHYEENARALLKITGDYERVKSDCERLAAELQAAQEEQGKHDHLLELERKDAKTQIASLSRQLADVQRDNQALRVELGTVTTHVARLETQIADERQRAADLHTTLTARDAEISRLKELLAAHETAQGVIIDRLVARLEAVLNRFAPPVVQVGVKDGD